MLGWGCLGRQGKQRPNGSPKFQGLKVKSVPSGMEGAKEWKEAAGGKQAA